MTSVQLDSVLQVTDLSATADGNGTFLSIRRERRRLPFILTGHVLLPNAQKSKPALEVYCLGKFQVRVDFKKIERWRSIKAESLLKYLIAHYQHPVSKDTLMEALDTLDKLYHHPKAKKEEASDGS